MFMVTAQFRFTFRLASVFSGVWLLGTFMQKGTAQNVGIGISTPAARLEVYDHDGVDLNIGGRVRISADGGGARQTYLEFAPWRGRPGGPAAQIRGIDDGNFSAHLTFWTAPAGSPGSLPAQERMRITPGGFVGIGTPAPAYVLDVVGRMRVRQGPDLSAGMWFFQNVPANDRAFVGMAGDDHVGFWGNLGAQWGFLMNVFNGNVGIGNVFSPAQRLHVDGTIRATNLAGTHPATQTYSNVGTNASGDIVRVNPVHGYLFTVVQPCAGTVEGTIRANITGGTLTIQCWNEGGGFHSTCYTLGGVANARIVLLITNDDTGNCPNPARVSGVRELTVTNGGGTVSVGTDLGCNGSDGNNWTLFIHYNPL